MTAPIYEFPRLEITSGSGRVRAIIIGKSALAKKLQAILRLQEIVTDLSEIAAGLNYSHQANFVYWFIPENSPKFPDALKNYLKNSSSKLIIIASELTTDEHNELITHILDSGVDACQVFLKDIYGPAVGESRLSFIWRDLKSKLVINLPDDDNVEIYPIYIDDAASAIVKISFSTQTYGRTFYISGPDKITILSFSYRLREEVVRQTQKLPAINYTQAPLRPSSFDLRPSAFDSAATRDFLSWQPEIDLSVGLSKLVTYCLPHSNPSVPSIPSIPSPSPSLSGPAPNNRKPLKKKTTFRFRRAFVFPLILATLFAAAILFLPPILDRFVNSLVINSPDKAAIFEPVLNAIGFKKKFEKIKERADINSRIKNISAQSAELILSIVGSSPTSPAELFDYLELQSSALLKKSTIGAWRQNLSLGRDLLPVARMMLAGDRKKTFLIVFQNSAEIRPTGGFTSSFAFVTLQKGKLLDIDYQSVYQLDSQLVGIEPPPQPIRDRLGESNWLIRDANWAADGRQSAKKIESLIERASGRRVDGTILLTTPALQSILAKTGEIVDSDGTSWNHQSVVERLVYSDRVDPQTGQRQDPLISLALGLEEFIKTNPNRHQVISGILAAISENNLLITSSDPTISQMVKTLQIDGSLPTVSCPLEFDSADCLSDKIAIVDANLGVNKADYFMIKEHDINISLSAAAQSSSAMTLRYYNSADVSAYPAGTYRNYVRVYLPRDSIITSVVRLSPEGLVAVPTDNSIEDGYKVIGWYMEIPVGDQGIFRLESSRSAKLIPQNQIASYSLSIRKQPGTAIPTSVSIGYPPSLAPLAVSDKVTVAGNKLLLNHSGENNLSLNVEFATTE